jgi:hypothetical protein
MASGERWLKSVALMGVASGEKLVMGLVMGDGEQRQQMWGHAVVLTFLPQLFLLLSSLLSHLQTDACPPPFVPAPFSEFRFSIASTAPAWHLGGQMMET